VSVREQRAGEALPSKTDKVRAGGPGCTLKIGDGFGFPRRHDAFVQAGEVGVAETGFFPALGVGSNRATFTIFDPRIAVGRPDRNATRSARTRECRACAYGSPRMRNKTRLAV